MGNVAEVLRQLRLSSGTAGVVGPNVGAAAGWRIAAWMAGLSEM